MQAQEDVKMSSIAGVIGSAGYYAAPERTAAKEASETAKQAKAAASAGETTGKRGKDADGDYDGDKFDAHA